MVDAQVLEVVRFLKNKHIRMNPQNEWLQGCCSWFTTNNPQSNIQELGNFVYDQWLLADLREIGESCLPTNLSNIPKTNLREKIALQVDSVVNVGESYYSQLLKIRNVCTANIDSLQTKPQPWEPKAKRMLKLTCTDGVQTVFGMEYQLIPALKGPFIPGFKILIIDPVECRKGIMLLGPQNVEVLGGESDSMVIENAMENVLARELGLDENPDPYNQSRPQNIADVEVDVEENNRPLVENRVPDLNEFLNEDDDIFLSEQLTQVENLYRNESPNLSGDNHISSNVPSTSNFSSAEFSSRTETNSSISSADRLLNYRNNSNNRKVGVACPIISSNNPTSKRPAPSPTHTDNKIPRTITEIDSFTDDFSTLTSSSENLKIKDLKKLINSSGTHRCIASFLRTTSKPKIRDDMWQLSGEISDDTGTIDVAFSDAFLEKMFEFSAVEISSQKDRVKSNPDVKERIDNILKRGVQRIISLKGQFQINFSSTSNLPKVVNVIQ